jgi:hypothetical protein
VISLRNLHLIAAGWIAICLISPAKAEEDPFTEIREEGDRKSEEPPPPSGVETITRNLSAGAEMIGRLDFTDHEETLVFRGGLGIELYTQIVTTTGTWGTAEAQLRVTWDENRRATFEPHNLYLEKRLLYGRLNIIAGHFQLPFGLEALPIDTHTTILQLSNPRVLGFKHDWGLGIRGQLSQVDYDLTWSLGSGMDFEPEGMGLVTARVGRPGFGLSVVAGERLLGQYVISGWRVGTDLSRRIGPLEILAEASAGADEGRRAMAFLLRLSAETPGGLLAGAAQYMIAEVPGPDRYQWAGLELAVRLPFISRQTYLRILPAVQESNGQWGFLVLSQLYLRFDT